MCCGAKEREDSKTSLGKGEGWWHHSQELAQGLTRWHGGKTLISVWISNVRIPRLGSPIPLSFIEAASLSKERAGPPVPMPGDCFKA